MHRNMVVGACLAVALLNVAGCGGGSEKSETDEIADIAARWDRAERTGDRGTACELETPRTIKVRERLRRQDIRHLTRRLRLGHLQPAGLPPGLDLPGFSRKSLKHELQVARQPQCKGGPTRDADGDFEVKDVEIKKGRIAFARGSIPENSGEPGAGRIPATIVLFKIDGEWLVDVPATVDQLRFPKGF